MHPGLATGLTNSLYETSDMVNLLCSLIINYKAVYKSTLTGNYRQSDKNGKDNEIFFTNCQYQRDRSMQD